MKVTDITSREMLSNYLNLNDLTNRGAEIGVLRGGHARCILKKWKGDTLFLIDVWKNIENKKAALNRLKEFENRCKIIHKSSINAANEIRNESLDFCYIDANHKYEYIYVDIRTWWDKVKPGGLLCGHDYGAGPDYGPFRWPAVAKVVNEFVAERNLTLHVEPPILRNITSWYITKNG